MTRHGTIAEVLVLINQWVLKTSSWDSGATEEERDYGMILVDEEDLDELFSQLADLLELARVAGLYP